LSGTNNYRVLLDEKEQVIRQYIEGAVDEAEAMDIQTKTGEAIPLLKNPDQVKLLIFTTTLGKTTPKARRIFYENVKRPALQKVAVIGTSALVKAFITFVLIISNSKKVRLFTAEQEALQWLHE